MNKNNQKNNKSKLFRHQLLITTIAVVAVVAVTLTGSYAIFSQLKFGNEYNQMQVGSLSFSYVDLSEEGNVLQLASSYPLSDTDGEAATPYRFSVENSGTIIANYTIKIVLDTDAITADGCSDNTLDLSYVRYKFDNNAAADLSSIKSSTNSNEYIAYEGTLQSYESNIHEIRVWLNESSPNSVLGKHFHGKVVVEIEQNNTTDPNTRPTYTAFADIIATQAQTPTETMFNYTNEGCYYDYYDNHKTVCVEGYVATNGIYTMDDDDGPSYFYRGDVNNLVHEQLI